MTAPIALIAYRRPDHLARVLSALQSNPECQDTVLYIFADGPKTEAHKAAVDRVHQITRNIQGFANVNTTFRSENWGLSRNIIDAARHVLDRHDEMIMVEDDILVAPSFLKFMNEALARYHDERRVACISGYNYPIKYSNGKTFFLKGAECWGWATWRDRWDCFNPDGSELLCELKRRGLQTKFDFDGAWRISQFLEDQIAGRNDSWAIRWSASCFLKDMLTLYPAQSLVQNIGFDGIGATHVGKSSLFDVDLAAGPVPVEAIEIEESFAAREAVKAYFQSRAATGGIVRRIAHFLPRPIFEFAAELRRRVKNQVN
jgi:hypothetical protein